MKLDTLSRLNGKLTGTLARILEKERWTGEKGENFLIATQNMIKADKLLFHGLGLRSEFSIPIFKKEIGKLGSALDRMGVNEFGIHVPVIDGLETEYGSHLELSTKSLLKTYFRKHKEEKDFDLKIIFSVDPGFMDILDPIVKKLRRYLAPVPDFSIIIDNKNRPQT
jgi:hypothetical protein